MKYLIEPWDHQLKAIERAKVADNFAFFFEQGCLARDTVIKVNSGGCSREYTIEELYRLFNKTELAANERGIQKSCKVRSFKGDLIGLNGIRAVIRSGEKEVWELRVKGKPRLKLTKDHEILTKRGWVQAGELKKGDMIACDGLVKHQKKNTKTVGMKKKYLAITVGDFHPFARSCLDPRGKPVRKLDTHRLNYEAFVNGKSNKEFKEATFKPNNLKFIDPSKFHIHHIDGDVRNNKVSNLEKMTQREHLKHHAPGYKNFEHGVLTWRAFESFTKVGKEMTYDIACEAPHHNFVANGIVVHNCGKTGAAINTIRYKCGINKRLLRTLIFCPPVVRENWKREFALHSKIDQKRIHVLEGSGAKRLKKFRELMHGPGAIFITNYEALSMADLFTCFVAWHPEILVLDESHRVKTHNAKRTKAMIKLADIGIRHTYTLTGTPILKDARDIWAQFRILDGGETFDKNYYAFQHRYFEDKNAAMKSFAPQKYFPNWQPKEGIEAEFNRLMYQKAYRVTKAEALDLPPIVRKKVFVEMAPDQARMYKEMRDRYVTYLEEKACVASIALTKGLRLQQIACGFFVDDEGDAHKFKKNPRIDALRELLEDIVPSEKVIVWASFKESYKQILEVCEKIGIETRTLTGGMTDKTRQEAIDSFQNDPKVRVIIANQQAGGTGVNLTAASCMIYFSKNFSLECELQSEARCHRGGSEVHKSITRIDLVTPFTIDEVITEALARKENLANSILDIKDKI
jgi:SNF2 family DNA or RNA helicase